MTKDEVIRSFSGVLIENAKSDLVFKTEVNKLDVAVRFMFEKANKLDLIMITYRSSGLLNNFYKMKRSYESKYGQPDSCTNPSPEIKMCFWHIKNLHIVLQYDCFSQASFDVISVSYNHIEPLRK